MATNHPHVQLRYGAKRTIGRPVALEKWLMKKMLKLLGSPPLRFVLWDEQEIGLSAEPAEARILIRDRGALFKLATNPDMQFGELYSNGRIEVEHSLAASLDALYRKRPHFVPNGLREMLLKWLNRPRSNHLLRSRENIHHHYNIGNDFYRLWLDEQMVYTCAYFPTVAATLEQAQIAKMDHVCRKLQLAPGDQVIEAGCGWGALALHMARNYGARVRAYNIATEQLAYARERARQEGLQERVEFIEGDYREINGSCDAFVSVGMLEHVGVEHYPLLGNVIDRCLKADGRGLIHSIGVNQPSLLNPWIERHIFPGANPPSLGQMMTIFEPANFSVLDVENLRLHYAKTLDHWLQRYEVATPRVQEMLGEPFVRAWRLYLAGSLAAFANGSLQLFQVVFARAGDNQIPWTRALLYPQGGNDGKL